MRERAIQERGEKEKGLKDPFRMIQYKKRGGKMDEDGEERGRGGGGGRDWSLYA